MNVRIQTNNKTTARKELIEGLELLKIVSESISENFMDKVRKFKE
jgi:hypothetical protein